MGGSEVRACAERLLNSRVLANAPSQREFLRFVVDETLAGRGADLKEYVIGVQALGRPSTFDPRTDASVRVAARRLRQRLDEYYAGEGRDAEVIVALERGGYQPHFQRRVMSREGVLPAPPGPVPSDLPVVPAVAPAWVDGRPRPQDAGTNGAVVSVPPPPMRRRRRRAVAGVAVGLAVIALGAWAWPRIRPSVSSQVIAVLPFANATEDDSTERVCFGVMEDLTTALTGLEGMEVIARTSASQFSGKGLDPVDVGRKLGADLLVEGSVRRDGPRLFVTAQLIETRKGTHVWAGNFEGNMAEGVPAQQQLARRVYEAVRSQLGRRTARVTQARRVAPDALDLYWKGRFVQSQPSSGSPPRAIEYFTQALVRDPSYADARAALGEALASEAFHQSAPPPDLVRRARDELKQALEADPESSPALASLAWIAFFYDHDWPAADRGLRQALAVNPSAASAHNLYALALAAHGQFGEAIEHSRAALRFDPVRYAARNDNGLVLWCARRYAEAETTATGVIAADPSYHVARVLRGLARMGLHAYPGAVTDLQAARQAMGPVSQVLARLVCAYALQGDTVRAQAVLAELEALRAREEAADVHLAVAYLALGNETAALDRLERAEARREADVNFVAIDPAFDRLRTAPRFKAVVQRLGLEP